MSNSNTKDSISVKPMPLRVVYLMICLTILFIGMGIALYLKEEKTRYTASFYFFGIISSIHFLLYISPSWRSLFSYGLGYSNALILISSALGLGLVGKRSRFFDDVNFYSSFRVFPHFPTFIGLNLQIVDYFYATAIALIIASAIAFYTGVLNEEKLLLVRSALFIICNRSVVVLATIAQIIVTLSFIIKFLISKPHTISIFSKPVIINPMEENYLMVQRFHTTLLLVTVLTITLVRPTSPIRSRFSKFVRFIILLCSSFSLVYYLCSHYHLVQLITEKSAEILDFDVVMWGSLAILFILMTLLEICLPIKHISALHSKKWSNLTSPYSSPNI